MEDEKNKTTAPQQAGGNRRRRRKKNKPAAAQAASQGTTVAAPGTESAIAEENTPAPETADTEPAVAATAVQETPAPAPKPEKEGPEGKTPDQAEPVEPAPDEPEKTEEAPAEEPAPEASEEAVPEQEASAETNPAEPAQAEPSAEVPQEQPSEPETLAEESESAETADAEAEATPAEPETETPAAEEPAEGEDQNAADQEETSSVPEAPQEPDNAAPTEEFAAPEQPETEPAPEEEDTEEDNAAPLEAPGAPEPEAEAEAEAQPDEEEEKRLSDMTRTVQLSVEQIMARVSEEEVSEPEEPEESEEEDEGPVTLQDHVRNGVSGMARWLLLVVFIVLVIAVCGVAWLYRSATSDMIPQITVTFAGQTLEPTAYKWKVPVIGNVFKRTYADTLSSTPRELEEAVEQASPDIVVSPSDYRTELTVTDADENEIFEGDVDTFSSFQFTANGTYTAKLVVHSDASSVPGDATVTGSETWLFQFTVGVRPSVYLSGTSVSQGGVVAVRVGDTLDGQKPELVTDLDNAGFFKASTGWICYLPIPWNASTGTQELQVKAGGYTETLELTIRAADWEYKDYSSASQRVTPYIGQDDIPAELEKLLAKSEDTIAWTSGGFVQPFLNSLDVKLAFGTTEYVGRSYSERSTNNGAGGRTLTNLVLNTTSGELLIAPASGTVVLAKDLGGDLGNTVVIDHGAGVKSIFYNLKSLEVKAGATVKQGQTLATCGRTTVAEMRIGTVPVDPQQIWRGKCDALKYY